MKTRLALLFIILFTIGNSYSQNGDSKALSIHESRVEYHENPEGIDVLQPRFSWILKGEGRNRTQSAYQIIVASSLEKLSQDQAEILLESEGLGRIGYNFHMEHSCLLVYGSIKIFLLARTLYRP